jgi:hypothetical protein
VAKLVPARRLLAEHAIELGGVPDRLVDRQPKIGRVDHEVVTSRGNARRAGVITQELRQLGDLGVPIPSGAGDVLPAPAGGRTDRAHRCESGGIATHVHRRPLGVETDPLLGRRRACGIGVEGVLHHLDERGVDVIHAVGRQEA